MNKKSVSFSVSKSKHNISGRIDPVLIKYIEAICEIDNLKKVEVFEEALWDYVEKRGFEKATDDRSIKITRNIPSKYSDHFDD